MNKKLNSEYIVSEAIYEVPRIEIVCFSGVDIMAASVGSDENEGEWDPLNEN